MFKIATLTDAQRDAWLSMLERASRRHETVQIAFDDLDQAVKWKVGNGPWSPPYVTRSAE